MEKVLKKATEILVECGYNKCSFDGTHLHWKGGFSKPEPFVDTLEGRRQANAIEDWLVINKCDLWLKSKRVHDEDLFYSANNETLVTRRGELLYRIKYCLENL